MHLVKDENGNVMPHGHDHEQGHGHNHEHDSACAQAAGDGCASCGGDCTKETVAVLKYMLDHNQHHAAELAQMAENLKKLGMDDAAAQISEGVSDFQKGNMRLSVALTLVNEHLKEA